MVALIAKLVPLIRQLGPLVKAAWPIVVAIIGALTDYFAGTNGKATAGALGLVAGVYTRRAAEPDPAEPRRFAATPLHPVAPPDAEPASPVIEYRATGDPAKPFRAVGLQLRGEWFSLADVGLFSIGLNQPSGPPDGFPADPTADPIGFATFHSRGFTD